MNTIAAEIRRQEEAAKPKGPPSASSKHAIVGSDHLGARQVGSAETDLRPHISNMVPRDVPVT